MTSKITNIRKKSSIAETIRTVVYALLIALVFRTLAYQPFSIPSGSMKPTLLEGDYLFVSKFAYGYSRNSIPFSPPILSGRLFGREPERGDIAVFKLPSDGRTDYIKRLIGLPGDEIQVLRGVVHINGQPVSQEIAGEFHEPFGSEGSTRCLRIDNSGSGQICANERLQETLPDGGPAYFTLNSNNNRAIGTDNTRPFAVPEGHYFFLGDNRDNSVDSRFSNGVGFVPAENLVGRAEVIFLSSKGGPLRFWNWRLSRIFDRIR